MRILHLIDSLEAGGAEKSLLAILPRLKSIEPLICHIYEGECLKPAFEENGIQVISLNLQAKYAFGLAVKRVLEVIRDEKPDLIHTTLFRANVVGRIAGRLVGLPVISSLVNESYAPVRFRILSRSRQWKLKVTQFIDRLTAQWVYHFIANSKAAKQSNCHTLAVPQNKVSVIYRGRESISFVSEQDNVTNGLRASLSLPPDGRIVLNVGRLIPQKNQVKIIQAMPIVLQKCYPVHVLIAGEGEERVKLTAVTRELNLLDTVTLLGHRSDIPALLHLADVFVFPSHYEGHPGALIEAMFAARPIVATDIPVHRETISDGATGLLVPVENPTALGQAITWMLQHPAEAKQMGEQARAVAINRFHIDRIAAQYEELYGEVLHQWQASE